MSGRIVVVGDVVTDVVAVLSGPLAAGSDTAARIRVSGGGQAANTAAWLAWSGSPVTLVAASGADEAGAALVAELTAAGVRCAVTNHPDVPTGSIVVLALGEERTMVTDRGANLTLAAEDVDAALAAAPDAQHLHLSGYTLLDAGSRGAGLRALAAAREHGLTSSVDAASEAPLRQVGAAAFADWVRGTDLLVASAEEAAVLAEAGPLTDLVSAAVIVKRGAAGASWYPLDGPPLEAATVPIDAVDPTGAGDAFAAGLLRTWLDGAIPEEALREGARLGALAVGRVGARPPH